MSARPLWSASEIADALGCDAGTGWTADGIAIDSRQIVPGDLFVAIEGPNHDGHDFVAAALRAGAVAALVARDVGLPDAATRLVQVPNTLAALGDLARRARRRGSAAVIAVTGSVGKTSIKDGLATVLAAQAKTHVSPASFNNHWGVPLSLARLPADAAYGVFELGMNHAGELTPLSRLVEPDHAMVANVEPTHLAFLGSLDGIAAAKAEVFAGLRRGGAAILNRDSHGFDLLRRAAEAAGAGRVLDLGAAPDCAVRAAMAVPNSHGSCVSARIDGIDLTYKIGVPGAHWVANSLLILAAAKALGADLARAALALADLRALAGRGARRQIALGDAGSLLLIDDSYNASPSAVRAAFKVLAQTDPGRGGRRIAVLGDMLELGARAGELHAGLAEDAAAAGIQRVLACGPEMRHLLDRLPPGIVKAHAADSAALWPLVAETVRPGDVVLVKGSLGMRMRTIVDGLLGLESPAALSGAA